jgi:hypothetical protein
LIIRQKLNNGSYNDTMESNDEIDELIMSDESFQDQLMEYDVK